MEHSVIRKGKWLAPSPLLEHELKVVLFALLYVHVRHINFGVQHAGTFESGMKVAAGRADTHAMLSNDRAVFGSVGRNGKRAVRFGVSNSLLSNQGRLARLQGLKKNNHIRHRSAIAEHTTCR